MYMFHADACSCVCIRTMTWLPTGLHASEMFLSWGPDAIDSVLNSDLLGRDRLLFALSHRIGLASHYSGCAGDLAWAPWISVHLVRMGIIFENDPAFVLVDCCDVLPHCRRCLKAFEPSFKHVCFATWWTSCQMISGRISNRSSRRLVAILLFGKNIFCSRRLA